MARKKKYKKRRKKQEEREYFLGLNPETKIGILAIFLFAVAAILLLSYFNLAGGAGNLIDAALATLFGWDRFLVPLLLLVIGANLLYPERVRLSIYNYLGLIFFFISFNGLINLIAFKESEAVAETLQSSGGYIGEFLHLVLGNIFGFWGALVAVAALLVVSILLIFNTSLRSVLSVHTHFTGGLGRFLHLRGRGSDEDDEDDWIEDEEEWEGDEEEEEGEEEEPKKEINKKRKKEIGDELEAALTTTSRRRVDMPMDLLETRGAKPNSGDINRNKEIIRRTFEQFGIDVEMGGIEVGPTVTQFTLRPSEGVKLTRIVSLQNDLALALAAHPIRIEAPIPGKSLVGIEVPNQSVALVSLREILESKPFKTRSTDLTVAIGKDVAGQCWVMPIEKMPHMLVAGATGSGKSVCLNTMIVSLLYQNGPDDVKFIMVDPKRVELAAYAGLPHLLVPPIMKVEETVNALKWTVREMERRLDVLSKFGARDIQSYNARAEAKMPKIIVVIDELADLMTNSAHEVEAAIIRIAQMARATGIHLILATQRPSVDVITGLIKANIPCRIAFAVASLTDSRTILDMSGAEKLLGRGDMLFSSAEMSKPKRLQGAYLSEKEIKRVVDFLKGEEMPDYNYEITERQKSGSVFGGNSDDEPLLEEAIEVILQAGKASTSLLQRRLKVGYSRAARIIDLLEDQGVVGPAEGAKPREILIENKDDIGGYDDDEENYEKVDEDAEEEDGEEEEEDVEEGSEEGEEEWDDDEEEG
ncbi:DNA translocase FtsK [Patescibacteria group bacterium]|nr:DNA translocase FtsK [Patescibacteria group bacterium]MBU1907161.1 DNA translocase FtsK [Patescibacteria group bacterium]